MVAFSFTRYLHWYINNLPSEEMSATPAETQIAETSQLLHRLVNDAIAKTPKTPEVRRAHLVHLRQGLIDQIDPHLARLPWWARSKANVPAALNPNVARAVATRLTEIWAKDCETLFSVPAPPSSVTDDVEG